MFLENVLITLLKCFPIDIQTFQTPLGILYKLYKNVNGSRSLDNMILFTAKSLIIKHIQLSVCLSGRCDWF